MNLIDRKTVAEYVHSFIPYLSIDQIENLIERPPKEVNYTYALPVFQLARHERKAPHLIAKELSQKMISTSLSLPEFLEDIKHEGPYLNFRLKPILILENIYQLKENYGRMREELENVNSNQKEMETNRVVVEYPSPNTNKPLHLGHVRNMLIGSSLSTLLDYKGNRVFQVNLNNDRGIHICKSMLAYKKLGENEKPDIKPDHFVGKFYVKYNELEEQDPHFIEEAQKLLKKWEEKDPQTRALWKKMNQWAVEGFEETYKKLGVSFDKQYFESDYYWKGKELVLKGYKDGIFEKTEDGAIVAPLEETYNLPDKILLRSDGTAIYITQDIYLAYLKKKDFNYDDSIYVVGNEQNLYFKQLFAVLEMLGFKERKYHLSYGMIYLPEGKMKSREGKVVDADDLIEEMKTIAYEEVDKRYPHLSKQEKLYRAESIGMAALKFFILKISPKSDFVFDPEESISFEGETGPYVQYVYARIQSILEKSTFSLDLAIDTNLLNDDTELDLIKYLSYFPEIIDSAAKNYEIHLIPQYLLNLCQTFNSFYSKCPVIQADKELQKARLLLIKCVQIVIQSALHLIGIQTLEEM
ncbi:MAG: Arginine--tRNA ligase [Promethearchaeota archaeon]|nr:MAG: Arginine--tRNA ligase [Candidatus Lokiarchaeota archaeon]